MNYRFLAVLLIVGLAAVAAHQSMTEPSAAAVTGRTTAGSNGPKAGSAASAAVTPVTSGLSKVSHTIGRGGAAVVGPGIAGMTRRTEEMLANLQPAVQKSPPLRRVRAERAGAQISKLDKAALAHLEAGEPIAAFRAAMQARGLIDVVRQQVMEESIR